MMAVPDRWAASARRLFAELGESRLEAVAGWGKMGQRSTDEIGRLGGF